MSRFILALFLPALLFSCASNNNNHEVADMVLHHAQVYTVNKNQPMAEAVAIKDGKILFVGSDKEADAFVGQATQVIDCAGQFLMPGFIEGHGHIHGLGESLVSLNLMHVKNWNEVIAMVAEAVKKAKPGDWIVGRGWHQEKWDQAPVPDYLGYPYHNDLDKVSPENPVLLSHASGHSVYVNAKAMQLAGINPATPNPAGGNIVKDKQGVIVGVLEETAQGLAGRAYNDWINKQPEAVQKAHWQHAIGLAEADCLKKGVTSFQDAGSSFKQVQWMKEMADSGKFNIRHWAMVREGNQALEANKNVFPIINAGNGFLTVKAVKVALDGALGSYGAWLLEPYSDRAGWSGLNTFPIDSLKKIAAFCWEHNLQLCVHAIGDRANREVINIYADQLRNDSTRDSRWRVEHAQHVNPAEIDRFRQWKVIASMQSIHCTSDGPFVPKRLGEKRAKEGAYVWRKFLDAGVLVTNGTDCPVEDVDPIACYYAAVTRKMANGQTFYPDEKMTREEALYSYTMANALSSFQEKEKGSIEPGKYADLTLLSNNLLTCPEDSIRSTRVKMTIVGGKIKYEGR